MSTTRVDKMRDDAQGNTMPIRRIAAALAGLKTALGITSPSREDAARQRILDVDPGFFLRREAEAMVDARARYAA